MGVMSGIESVMTNQSSGREPRPRRHDLSHFDREICHMLDAIIHDGLPHLIIILSQPIHMLYNVGQ
jgi:hypothetical protein